MQPKYRLIGSNSKQFLSLKQFISKQVTLKQMVSNLGKATELTQTLNGSIRVRMKFVGETFRNKQPRSSIKTICEAMFAH